MDDPKSLIEETVIPVVVEELDIGVRKIVTGAVRVHKTVLEHEEILDQPLVTEGAEVRRVVVNRPVSGPLPTRTEGTTIIVPVVKEVLKVEKHWVLTEEIHITRVRSEERSEQTVTVRQEQATVQRVDGEGRVTDFSPTEIHEEVAPRLGSGSAPILRQNKVVK